MLLLELVKSVSLLATAAGPDAAAPGRSWMNWITACVVAAGAAGAWLHWPARQATSASYMTGAVERGSLRRTIEGSGTVIGPRKIEVSTPLPGVVRFHNCGIESKVDANQLSGAIEDGVSRATVTRLQVALANVPAVAAKNEMRRVRARIAFDTARAAGAPRNLLLAQRGYEEASNALHRANAQAAR
jgi:P-type Ca2+ transporter type 2C